MAKKKEQELTYMQEPIPSSTKKYQTTKLNWSGLNYEQTVDTGALSMEKNISTEKAPYLTPSSKPSEYINPKNLGVTDGFDYKILSVHPFEGMLVVVWHQWNDDLISKDVINANATFVSLIRRKNNTNNTNNTEVFSFVLRSKYEIALENANTIQCAEIVGYSSSLVPRSIVQFNVNTSPLNPLANDVDKRLVIFPDKKSLSFDANENKFKLDNIETPTISIDGSKIITRYDSDNLPCKVTFNEDAEYANTSSEIVDGGNGRTYFTINLKGISKYKLIGITKNTNFTKNVKSPQRIIFEFDNSDRWDEATVRVARLEPNTAYKFKAYGVYEDVGENYTADMYESFGDILEVSTTDDSGTGAYFEFNILDIDETSYYRNASTGEAYQYNTEEEKWRRVIIPTCPAIQYAVVHQSRVFGVGGSKVYASGFNDYTNWNLDTVDEYNESNAWCSSSQSNTKADGDFTGITTFQNSVLLFKKDNMQEVRNNKNPFRLLDIFNEGAVNNQSVQDVNGILIFCTGEKVITYNGGNPRIISHPLGVKKFNEPISGTDGRCYFLYCKDEDSNARLFVYDTYVGEWSERTVPLYEGYADSVVGFAHNDAGMYMACEHNGIYKLDTDSYTGQEWSFETDVMTNHTVDIKHLNKFQIYAEFKSASLKVSAIYDDKDKEPTEIYFGEKLEGIKPIRVLVRKSANYSLKLRFEGTGYMKLHSMNLITSSGGNLYV